MKSTQTRGIRKAVSIATDPAVAAKELFEALDQPDLKFAVFHCSPAYDTALLGAELARWFDGVPLVGCTTAGEITPDGYLRGSLTGVSLGGSEFDVRITSFDDLDQLKVNDATNHTAASLETLQSENGKATRENTFAFLLVDGLCTKEELLVSAIYRGLGGISLFGGSAGDATRFQETFIYVDGAFRQNGAVCCLIRTSRPFKVFRTQHFVSSSEKLVVTEADPGQRIVTEINGGPAATEYARALGLKIDQLTPLVFATHPVVVRVGGNEYVRSIQKVNDDGSLTFFCAIDEGIVLTAAKGLDLVANLEETFESVRGEIGTPDLVIGCDCILRHLEIDREDVKDSVSRIFQENNVVGFSTYGEQFNAMHVNQTFTGVAIGS